MQLLRTKNIIAKTTLEGMGISARKMDDGKWVKTIVFTLPMRLEMEEAAREEAEEMMLVVKNSVPSWPSGIANFTLKKYVIHEAGTRPEARESMAKRRQSFRRMERDEGEICGQIDFRACVVGSAGLLASTPRGA